MNDSSQSAASSAQAQWSTLRWPHWQRLAERWWRRWGFALSGVALGGVLVWLARPEMGDAFQQASDALAQQRQQNLALTERARAKVEKRPHPAALSDLENLPDASQKDQLWPSVHKALTAHGLRLKSMRNASLTEAAGAPARLPSQVLALRLEGQFADWARFWQACTDTGPLCSMDRVGLLALPEPGQVQIDVELRLWMRAADPTSVANKTQQTAWPLLGVAGREEGAAWAQLETGVPLFALEKTLPAPATMAVSAQRPAGSAPSDDLPADPRHWPLARLRWLGMWQQGQERLAYISAGPHWTPVVLGQRVTQEGHRVVAIAPDGVRLRLAQEAPVFLTAQSHAVNDHQAKGGQ